MQKLLKAVRWKELSGSINKSRLSGRLTRFAWALVRTFLLTGLCFMILYPLFITVSRALMGEADMNDTTVVMLPKHLSFAMLQLAAGPEAAELSAQSGYHPDLCGGTHPAADNRLPAGGLWLRPIRSAL